MFDIGFAEVLVLAIIGMVVIGPERLPGVARTVGKYLGQARRTLTGLQNQIEQEIKLDELNRKIMAETKDLETMTSKVLTHENEDAQVPKIQPNAVRDDIAEVSAEQAGSDAEKPSAETPPAEPAAEKPERPNNNS